MDWFWGIVAIIGSVGGVGVLIYLQARGGTDRVEEDGARAYFDEHQRWPDESPEDVAAARGHHAHTSSMAGVIVEDAPPRPPWWRRVLARFGRRRS